MVRVEFYGIPRRRAGVSADEVSCDGATRLGDLLRELGRRYPVWAEECLEGERLREGFLANIDGETFVLDPNTLVASQSCLLIMAADSGG